MVNISPKIVIIAKERLSLNKISIALLLLKENVTEIGV